MVNLRREWCALLVCAVGALGGLAACGRTPTEASTLSLSLSASAVKLAPGQTGMISVQVTSSATLKSPVKLTAALEAMSELPEGLAVAFEPEELTVAQSAGSEMRIAALPTATAGSYSLLVTARRRTIAYLRGGSTYGAGPTPKTIEGIDTPLTDTPVTEVRISAVTQTR